VVTGEATYSTPTERDPMRCSDVVGTQRLVGFTKRLRDEVPVVFSRRSRFVSRFVGGALAEGRPRWHNLPRRCCGPGCRHTGQVMLDPPADVHRCGSRPVTEQTITLGATARAGWWRSRHDRKATIQGGSTSKPARRWSASCMPPQPRLHPSREPHYIAPPPLSRTGENPGRMPWRARWMNRHRA